MDFIITFFRDILDGPLYIIVAIISIILICSCIGYLAEMSLNKKKLQKDYEESHASVGDVNQGTSVNQQFAVNDLESVNPIEVSSSIVESPNTNSVTNGVVPNQQMSGVFPQPGVINQMNSPSQQMNIPIQSAVPQMVQQSMPQMPQQQVPVSSPTMPQMPPVPNMNPNTVGTVGTTVGVPEVVNTVNNIGQQ